ncbi:MAG TPA: phosphatase PAP2 family protein [Solirubrobacteraceae bacterium]|nr:phosphatase PAP2 family protein [Solirubrobacteraceae bacterium]
MRRSNAIRAAAWGVVVAGVAAPLVRKRVKAPPIVTQTVAFAAPFGLCVAMRRSRTRDVATCALQMWAYLAAYKSPHDDPAAQERRVRIDYPIVGDRVLGLGELPTMRLQRALARCGPDGPEWHALDRVLVWAHWAWFMVPHGSLAYILLRHRGRFPRAAVMTYAVFDIGATVYWLLPTAPPWYAASAAARGAAERGSEASPSEAPAERGSGVSPPEAMVERGSGVSPSEAMVEPEIRRMMVEYGEFFWRDGWGPLYSVFGGNPLAAMPSLHFATSLMAALLLTEVGPVVGVLGWSYTATLGFALVYLGEHYVVDLLAGAVLTAAVRRLAPRAGPVVAGVGRAVAALEAQAHAAG